MRTKHESFGKISIHRVNLSKARPLFGTDITHKNTITLEIHTAEHERQLNNDYLII